MANKKAIQLYSNCKGNFWSPQMSSLIESFISGPDWPPDMAIQTTKL